MAPSDLDTRLEQWMAELEARHLSDLTFQEIARALRALSSTYVERRGKLPAGAALSGAGKRAAFALFYGPLHFLLVHYVASELGSKYTSVGAVLEPGCGTGASAAGWTLACDRPAPVVGVDRHPWAVQEARHTFADLRLSGAFHVGDLVRDVIPSTGPGARRVRFQPASKGGILLAYTVNEITEAGERQRLLSWLLEQAKRDVRVLIVEPLAGFVAPWWGEWQQAIERAGGRADQWRVSLPLPPIVEKLDRAAGLNHRELKARSLAL